MPPLRGGARPGVAKVVRKFINAAKRGVPAFVVQGVFVAAASVIGRKVLRLQLERDGPGRSPLRAR